MKKIVIVQDVRFLGVGYPVSKEPVAVDAAVADELLKLGFAEEAVVKVDGGDPAPGAGDASGGAVGGENETGGDADQGNAEIQQKSLFPAPENKALGAAPENK